MTTQEMLKLAREAKTSMMLADTEKKNAALTFMADELIAGTDEILAENEKPPEVSSKRNPEVFFFHRKNPSGKQCAVICKFRAACAGELCKQGFHGQFFLILTADIENDLPLVHHNEPVAVFDGILHIVRDHQGR